MKTQTSLEGRTAGVRTFLIADVRGYTRFTREHGDAQAARLAKKFADLARDAVEARGGEVIELRGDEALAVFTSTPQAVRAALEFQWTCAEETTADPSLPLTVGIGIDVGEAVPVEDGFRGAALNTAARLCSRATAGQVLVTRDVVDVSADGDEIVFRDQGAAELKGFEAAVDVIEALPARPVEPRVAEQRTPLSVETALPPELDVLTPLVDRDHEMHWLRGTWRQARRGRGRIVFASGPSQIGKTRLVAEIAAHIVSGGDRVHYAGPGGAAAAFAIAAIREAENATDPVLVVLDDLDIAGGDAPRVLREAFERIPSRPVLAIGLVKDPDAQPDLAAAIEEADRLGDGHVRLSPLDLKGVEGITRLYVGDELHDVPLESMVRASGGVPGRVHEVVSEWARDEAGRRLAAAAQWLADGNERRSADLDFANNVIKLRLGRLYAEDGEGAGEEESPYKGLASFEEADSAYFFGRERLVGELAARTVGMGMLGVLGASGSGKSSAVAAGLLPSLRAGLLPGSERWTPVIFRPGEHPMSELARAIATVAPESSLDDAIAGLGPEGRFVVAIDQFEEVFTLCADDAERDAFIDAITKAATRSPEKIVFIPTIRDDFYGRCAPYRELSEMLAANHVLVPPMAGDELRRAIELPARRARLRVEVALVDALVAEVAEETGGLPLLSAALVELWQAREDRWLRMSAYEQTGGVRGAVARLAEASYLQLGETERDSARGILLRLSDIGDGSVLTRRRVSISEFDVGRDAVAADVLARLTRDRLLTMSDSTVEVAHEALLREWPRLRGWLEEDVQGHQLHRHLTQAAKQWDASAREASELYRGARLSTALDWSATRSTDLNELERDFLAQSRQASERDAERQRRTNRRLRSLLIGTAVFLVVAVIAGGLALVQRGNAQERARIATARELSAAAVANLEVDPERSILLALEAVDATWDADRTVLPEAEEALHRALRRSRLVRTLPGSDGLAVSGDGKRFATTSKDGTASVWDLASGRKLLTLRGHSGAVNGIAISRDGRRLATTGADGTIRIWDGSTARQIHSMRGHRGAVWLPAFSPNGRWLVTTGEDYTTRIWDVAAGRQKHQLEGSVGEAFLPRFLAPVFSPDGSRVASPRWDGSARIWDPSTGKTVVDLSGHTWEIVALAFSQDSRRVATVSPDGVVRISDARSGKHLSTFSGHQGDVNAVAYSPDGSRIATGASDGSARLWDAATGEELLSLPGRTSEIYLVAFTPDGDRLLTTGVNGYTQIWDIGVSGGRDWLTVPGPAFRLGGVAFSPDGKTFAVPSDPSASREGSGVTIRDVGTGAVVATLRGHDALVYDFDFSVDGSKLAAAPGTGVSEDPSNRTLPIWDVKTGKLEANLTGHGDQISAAALSPDGRHAVTASYDGTLREWDIATGKQQRMLKVGADAYGLGFSPDGRLLLAGIGADGPVTIWDAATFEKRGELRGHTGYIQDIEFGPNGRVLTSSGDGTAKVWDLASRRVLLTLRGHTGPLVGVAFSPDGQRIATSSYDGTAKVWDATTGGHLFTLFGHERIVHSVAFSPDGRLLATASGDGTVALHLLPIEELRRLARDRVTRGLTDDECRQYLHVANCRARR